MAAPGSHVAFIRAINVGGSAVVPMSDLRDLFVRAGAREVRTYIASGNVLFDAPARSIAGIVGGVQSALTVRFGKQPAIIVRTAEELRRLNAANPFTRRRLAPDVKRYVAFLARAPKTTPALPIVSKKEALEVFAVDGREAFIISRRKESGMYGFPNLTVEEQLGVTATLRNWNTVEKIAVLLRSEVPR